MGVESAIGFAIIGYGLVAGGIVASAAARDAAKKEKSTKETEEARLLGRLQPPAAAQATPEQKAAIRKKTRTILTKPLTSQGELGIPAPTLLGEGDITKSPVVG